MNGNLAVKMEEELATEALTLYEQALQIKVVDQPTYAAAGEFGKNLKDLEKKIVLYFEPLKKAAHEAHKAITKKEADELSPVKEAMDVVRKSMNTFLAEQERIRREEEARLRREEEARAQKERDRLMAQAVKAEEKGNEEKAEKLLERAECVYAEPVAVAPTVETTVKTSAGTISAAKDKQVTVVDLKTFLAELVKRNMAPTMIEVKAGPLKAWAKANGFDCFPGLSIKDVSSVRF